MPLDAAKATAKINAIIQAFDAIGVVEPTRQPRSRRNNEPVAWEFYVATHLAKLAEARKRQAIAAAVAAGVLFDHEKEPMAVGTERDVYAGDVVQIALVVSNPSRKLDVPGFVDALEKAGVKRKLLLETAEQHTTDSRAPHRFTASLARTARPADDMRTARPADDMTE